MRVIRGVLGAVRGHPRVFFGVAAVAVVMSILGPLAVLSVARRPVDYFTFNPWLKRLPAYVVSPSIPLAQKLEKLPALALFWFSSNMPTAAPTGASPSTSPTRRILLLAGLFGAYFALLAHRQRGSRARRPAQGPGVVKQ